jgi:hypothetical protein
MVLQDVMTAVLAIFTALVFATSALAQMGGGGGGGIRAAAGTFPILAIGRRLCVYWLVKRRRKET